MRLAEFGRARGLRLAEFGRARRCNDPVAKSALSKKILAEYDRYANDAALIASGDVRPCGASCWQAALAALRVERPGQYFAPVFPPATR